MLASTRQSQSYHNAMFDSSMPDSFDSVGVAFHSSLPSHLPRLCRHGSPPPLLSLLRSSFFVSLGNVFSMFVRTFTSFLRSHLLSHSTPVSEVPTYWVKETRVPGFFPWGSYLSTLWQGPGNWRDKGCSQDWSNSYRCDDGDEEGVM